MLLSLVQHKTKWKGKKSGLGHFLLQSKMSTWNISLRNASSYLNVTNFLVERIRNPQITTASLFSNKYADKKIGEKKIRVMKIGENRERNGNRKRRK